MKRIVLALPVVAAFVFFCLSADALDAIAAQATTILPEPPATLERYWWVALFLTINAAVRTGLSNDTVKLPTAAAPWRAFIVAILAAVEAFFDGFQHGLAFNSLVLTFLMLNLPTIVQEGLKAIFGAKPGAGSGGASGGSSTVRPPPGYSTPLQGDDDPRFALPLVKRTPAAVGVAIGACALLFAGCGAGKVVCPLIDVAAEVCPLIAIKLPDGTTEMVPREAVMGVAMGARAARLSGVKAAADAGADQ